MANNIRFNHRIFYSSYWGTYSRVLQWPRGAAAMVELNLTPVNMRPGARADYDTHIWDTQVKPIIIRRHGTSFDRNDRSMDTVPMPAYEEMTHFLDEELRDYLLYSPIKVEDIDWEKYDAINNGGAPLTKILYTGVDRSLIPG